MKKSFETAIKIAGSARNCRVGRISGNTSTFILGLRMSKFIHDANGFRRLFTKYNETKSFVSYFWNGCKQFFLLFVIILDCDRI